MSWDITLLYFFIWSFKCFGQNEPIKVKIFRLSTSCMKTNHFKPRTSFSLNFASPFSFTSHNSYEILYLKHYMFGQKEPIKVQFFRFLRVLMKVHLILYAIFETARSGFIQIWHHCSVSWKITPLYFCSSNLAYFGQKEPIEKKVSDFWVVWWKPIKFLMLYLKLKVSFSLNFASLFSVMRDNYSALFFS